MNNKQLTYYSELLNEYINSKVCMAEFLTDKLVPIDALTFEEVFEIYIKLMSHVNGDRFYTIKEGELIEL